jgi:hypothetical protein
MCHSFGSKIVISSKCDYEMSVERLKEFAKKRKPFKIHLHAHRNDYSGPDQSDQSEMSTLTDDFYFHFYLLTFCK